MLQAQYIKKSNQERRIHGPRKKSNAQKKNPVPRRTEESTAFLGGTEIETKETSTASAISQITWHFGTGD
jgi:hypothetical protein